MRERILASARELFACNGIDKTSMRAVARTAEVNAALVHHYFGTKQQLVAAAIHIPIDPMEILIPMRQAHIDELGLRLPLLLLDIWDSERGAAWIATLRSLIAGGGDVSLTRSFLQEMVTAGVGSRVDSPPGTAVIRAEFVVAQMLGVVMARYIVKIEPFASLPAEQVAQTIAPSLQRYFTGELPGIH
ncbi:TetR family transcriptional regulator [Mycobacterium spongiae]|nr:TetR family transcriptional regulator [Mycobacterium spongiae]